MSLRIQVNPNDESVVGFINEKPVIGIVTPWRTVGTLFNLDESGYLTSHLVLADVEFLGNIVHFIIEPDNLNNPFGTLITRDSQTGRLAAADLFMWTRVENDYIFNAIHMTPASQSEASISDYTEMLADNPARIRFVDPTNIEYIYEEETT